MRHAYFIFGWLFFGLGAVGVAVPGLPTTVFMLLALWSFSKSSQRFHDWLYTHRIFGPPLRQWRIHRVIPLKAKLAAVIMMGLSLIYLVAYSDVPTWLIILTALLISYGAWFILRQPTHPPPTEPDTEPGPRAPRQYEREP